MPIRTPEERVGTVLAERYRLDRIIGQGGMGVVYSGVHTFTGKDVAIKVLLHQALESPTVRKRFFQEAKAGGTLQHPNVVAVLDSGEDQQGEPYIAMELLRGESLAERLGSGVLPPDAVLEIALPIIDALEAAHRAGIVHRDIKPGNVFLQDVDGSVVPKLLDFGVVKMMTDRRSLTNTGVVMGTPYYLSPEQAGSGGTIGPATDVWSMGVLLLRALAGVRPFEDEEQARMIVKVATSQLPPCREWAPGLAPGIANVLDRCLRLDPSERIGTMHELGQALVAAARSENIVLREVPATLEPPTDMKPLRGIAEMATDDAAGRDLADSPGEPVRLGLARKVFFAVALCALAIGSVAVFAPESLPVDVGADQPVARRIETIPTGATVVIEGQEVGETPMDIEVPATHSVPVRLAKSGFFPSDIFVAATDPEVISVTLRSPEAGEPSVQVLTRVVSSDPAGAVVMTGGEVRGRTPMSLRVSSEESLEVDLSLSGYWPQTIYLSTSDPEQVNVTLRPRQ